MLVVAAFAPELQRFRELRPEAATAVVGIGLVHAALGASELLSKAGGSHGLDGVLLLGTCGSYPGAGLRIGDLVIVTTSVLVDPTVVSGRATSLGSTPLASASKAVAALDGLGRSVVAATTLSLTGDRDLGAAIVEATGASVEHLETHAVASACERFGVPFVAALAVANEVGPNGRTEWRDHHRAAEDALGQAIAARYPL